VRQLLDRVRVEGDEPVEAGDEGDPLGLAAEVEPPARRGLAGDGGGEGGERLLVDRPEVGRRGLGRRSPAV
jgi:hypothetical protein